MSASPHISIPVAPRPRLILEELARPTREAFSAAHSSPPHHHSHRLRRSYDLGTRTIGVRDAIINILTRDFPREPFLFPFMDHLLKMGTNSLDPYSELVFELQEYNVRLIFRADRPTEHDMSYKVPDLRLDPDPRLMAPPTVWRRLFG
jgi:hypothetical protein